MSYFTCHKVGSVGAARLKLFHTIRSDLFGEEESILGDFQLEVEKEGAKIKGKLFCIILLRKTVQYCWA